MTKTDFAKNVVSFVVGIGTKQIVTAIIRNNISPEKVTDKVTIEAATWVLSGLVALHAKEYTDKMIDEMIEQWLKIKSHMKDARQE